MEYNIETPKDLEEYLNSSLDESSDSVKTETQEAENRIKTTYVHMLKYMHQKDHQTKSWIDTIQRDCGEIKELATRKNVLNNINDELLNSAYRKAITKASKETEMDAKKFDKNRPIKWLFENLINDDFILDFLHKESYTSEAIKEVNKLMEEKNGE